MPIIVYCKACAKKIRAPDAAIGKAGKCPRCNAEVPIPSASEDGPPKGLSAQPEPDDVETAPEAPPASKSEPPPKAAETKAPAPQPKPTAAPAPPVKGKPISLRLDKLEDGVKLKATREDLGEIAWDTAPGLPSHWPWVFGLLALLLTALGGWVLWYSAGGSEGTAPAVTPAEERQRLQFQVPPANDGFRDLRQQQAPKLPGRVGVEQDKKTDQPPPAPPEAPEQEAPAAPEAKSPTPEAPVD
ncbi:MAG: hypothetical protein L6R28_07145 [Planctomycetes bacterium]|nr:hypothetical protein [Planctomycetota bacterium]